MLQVCPSISHPQRRVLAAAPRPPRRAPASLPAAASSGRSRSARPRTCMSCTGGRDHLDVHRVRRRPVVGRSRHRHRHRHGPFLLRRRPERLPLAPAAPACRSARPAIRQRVADPDPAPSPSPSRSCPTSTVHGLHCARHRRRSVRRRRRRRAAAGAAAAAAAAQTPHARVIPDPELPVVVVARARRRCLRANARSRAFDGTFQLTPAPKKKPFFVCAVMPKVARVMFSVSADSGANDCRRSPDQRPPSIVAVSSDGTIAVQLRR